MNTQTFLFTGAGGYIGSHTAFCFLQNLKDCKVVIYDNLSTGFIENVNYLQSVFPNRVEFVQGDVGDTAKLDELMKEKNFSAAVHFAASLIVPESVEKPLLYYKNNTLKTTLLVELCVQNGINKFIFSSTAAVYGQPDSEFIPVKENAQLVPINPYGASKMFSERVMSDTANANKNFNFVALRYFNVAGASSANTQEIIARGGGLGQRSKNATHLIKVACEAATGKREQISIFGRDYDTDDGTCVRDYIHIDDLSAAHLSALEFLDQNARSEIFNVGYGRGASVQEVIDILKRVSGVDFKVLDAKRRIGDAAILVADSEKIKSLTSWRPKFDNLEIIVKSAYEWEKNLH